MAPHRPGCREKPTCGAQANEAMRRETTFAARHGAKARARAEVRARAAAWANDSKIGRATRPVNGPANDVARPLPRDVARARDPAPAGKAGAEEAGTRETMFAARHGAKARARVRAAAWANDSKIGRATRPVNGSANDVAKARDPAPADKAGAEEAGTPETMCGARHGAEARGVANSSDKRTEVRMSAPEHFHLHHKGAPVGHSRTKPDA